MTNGTSRQWPHLVTLRDRARKLPGYRGTILIGSLAAAAADDLSDVDVILALEDGSFDAAWDRRDALRPADAMHHWDIRTDDAREIATHNWFTRDLVLVECVFTTRRGGLRLAEPFAVFDGDAGVTDSFSRREPVARGEIDEYNAKLRAEGQLPDFHLLYGDFVRAVRAARRHVPEV